MNRDDVIASLYEANQALRKAHEVARLKGWHDLATYIADLAADTFSTMAEVSRGRYAERAEAVCS